MRTTAHEAEDYTARMRGLLFTEFIALVEEKFGIVTADALLSLPGLTDGGAYTSVGRYPHGELVSMVGALAERTGLPADELCRVFGEWVFPKLASSFEFAVKPHADAFSFLASLDAIIHAEVRKLYPDAELPAVPVRRVDDRTLQMEYRSKRPFADVAEGLLRGCAAWFGDRVDIRREPLDGSPAHAARFTLTRKDVP